MQSSAVVEMQSSSQILDNNQNMRARDVFDEISFYALYLAYFPDEVIEEYKCYPGSSESTVVEINNEYIIKIPKSGRGTEGVVMERDVTRFINQRVAAEIPCMQIYDNGQVLARYKKLPGETIDPNIYNNLSIADKNALAHQLASFMCDMHAITLDDVKNAKISFNPSWSVDTKKIITELKDEKSAAIKALLKIVVQNHAQLEMSDDDTVFGHFDLHGANLLLNDKHTRLLSVIDFGNCKIGDLHQDLSMIYFSSVDLANRVIENYCRISRRNVNRVRVQHYTTVFYLNLLASLKSSQSSEDYRYRLKQFEQWYLYLLNDRAQQKASKQESNNKISDDWKEWMFASYIKGESIEKIKSTLIGKGFSDLDIATELKVLEQHPYTKSAKKIQHMLAKRNWLLRAYDRLFALDSRYSKEIEVRQVPEFSGFMRDYYSKQLPVVLKGGVDHWPALEKWSPEYFVKTVGDAVIEVQMNRDCDPLYERNSIKHKTNITMREFVQKVQSVEQSNDFYMTANNTEASYDGIKKLFEDVNDFGNGYRKIGELGSYIWFGPKGTFTPLHHDLTNNMLIQIYGRKKVTLIPAMQVPHIYNDMGVFSATSFPALDVEKYPSLKNITTLEIIIGPGDSLFIPLGWWHCVESLDVSISFSFTDFDSANNFLDSFPV